MNGVTYYYYVTTDYSPAGTESGPSNIADATPVEWVELSISDGAALSGYTDTLEISINNESEIGFFYIEITDDPDYIIAEAVLQTDRTQNYTLSVTETNGVMVVSALPNGSSVTLESGNDPVCKVIVRGASMEPAFVDLDFTFANIENYNGVEMNWTGDDADFEVSVETQILAASIRNVRDVGRAFEYGANVCTLPVKVFDKMYDHVLTEKGLELFNNDYLAAIKET